MGRSTNVVTWGGLARVSLSWLGSIDQWEESGWKQGEVRLAGETRTETYSLRERLERSGFTEAWLVRLAMEWLG